MLSGDNPVPSPVIYVVGPTASGKTRLAVELGLRLDGEAINADSRQVYRYMDIGTAKPTPEERAALPHHLLDLLSPNEDFSLGSFLSLARRAVADVAGRGKVPLVVGGTGQYIWALAEGWDVPEVAPDPAFRERLESEARQSGALSLHGRLAAIDPLRAAELDPNNVRRVIRALEVHLATGRKPSSFGKRPDLAVPGIFLGISLERETLYARIDRRVDRMMEEGFLAEAEALATKGFTLGKGPLACPGYRELGQFLEGELDLEEAVQRTKFQTHRLARKQATWFKQDDTRLNWLEGEYANLTGQVEELIAAWNRSQGGKPG